jgi:hypothetical protein
MGTLWRMRKTRRDFAWQGPGTICSVSINVKSATSETLGGGYPMYGTGVLDDSELMRFLRSNIGCVMDPGTNYDHLECG